MAGKPVTATVRVKGTSGATPIRCSLHYFDIAGTWLGNASSGAAPDGTWQLITVNSTIPANTTAITVAFDKPGFSDAADTVYVDELLVA